MIPICFPIKFTKEGTFDHDLGVPLVLEIVEVDDGSVRGIGRAQFQEAATPWMEEARRKREASKGRARVGVSGSALAKDISCTVLST